MSISVCPAGICGLGDGFEAGVAVGDGFVVGVAAGLGGGIVCPSCCAKTV